MGQGKFRFEHLNVFPVPATRLFSRESCPRYYNLRRDKHLRLPLSLEIQAPIVTHNLDRFKGGRSIPELVSALLFLGSLGFGLIHRGKVRLTNPRTCRARTLLGLPYLVARQNGWVFGMVRRQVVAYENRKYPWLSLDTP